MQSILLFTPPYGDFTYPYHSLSYLVAPLRNAGYDLITLDLNIKWFRSVFTSHRISRWREVLLERLREAETSEEWSLDDQKEAVRIVRSLAIAQSINPEEAIAVLRSEAFYDYERYIGAQNCIRNFERLLEYFYPNFPFFTAFAVPPGETSIKELVEGALASEEFINDVRKILRRRVGNRKLLFCGMSAPFYSNLRLGFAALEAVVGEYPDTLRIAGGTAVTDMFKNRRNEATLKPLSRFCDYLMLGEADQSIIDLAKWCSDKQEPPDGIYDVRVGKEHRSNSRKYFALAGNANPMPDYSWIEWDLYLSPERQVNYSPTRGCFWNKCTFCDYGLNEDLPTAPYRAENVETAVEHFHSLSKMGISHVYLAVDAIAPSFLKKFATRLIEEKIEIKWSAEFFLTKNFDFDFARLLEESGLVTASFGFESGSSRVLELMGKGKNRVEEVYEPAVKAFSATRIGLQPKFFFGFPTENDEERWATVRFLNRNRGVFSIVTSGNVFELTFGSIVAKEPSRFGVTNVRRKEGTDISGACDYDVIDKGDGREFSHLNTALGYFHAFERPWCGGIDTFHSKLYIERFGREVFELIRQRYSQRDELTKPWASIALHSHFDLDESFNNVLVANAMEHQCTIEAVNRNLTSDEVKEGMNELMIPIQRGTTDAPFRIRFC